MIGVLDLTEIGFKSFLICVDLLSDYLSGENRQELFRSMLFAELFSRWEMCRCLMEEGLLERLRAEKSPKEVMSLKAPHFLLMLLDLKRASPLLFEVYSLTSLLSRVLYIRPSAEQARGGAELRATSSLAERKISVVVSLLRGM